MEIVIEVPDNLPKEIFTGRIKILEESDIRNVSLLMSGRRRRKGGLFWGVRQYVK